METEESGNDDKTPSQRVPSQRMPSQRVPRGAFALAGLLAAAGTAHFVTPRSYDALIPDALPGSPRLWTHGSGIAELAIAAGLALPKTRRAAGFAAAALFVGVFPGNVKMAIDYRDRPPLPRAVAYARLPLQIPLVLWALRVARGAKR
jgi:uncharacterized membrane protein